MSEGAIPPINANQLRALAERADSYREVRMFVVLNESDSAEPYTIVTQGDLGGRAVVMILETTHAEPKPVDRTPITLSSEPPVVLEIDETRKLGLEACDAVFTTMVAVEKFLIPYYARHRSTLELAYMRDGFAKDVNALAMTHIPDSIPSRAIKRDALGLYVLGPDPDASGTLVPLSLDAFVAAKMAN